MKIYTNSRLFWEIHSKPENSKKHKNNKCKFKQIVKRIHSCQLLTVFLTPSLLPKKLLLTWTFEFAGHKHSSKNLEHMVRTPISRFEFPANCSESKISQYSGPSLKGTLKLKIIRDRRLFSTKSTYSSFSGLILTWRIVQMLSILSLRAFCNRCYHFSFHKSPHWSKFVLSGKRYLRSSFLYQF